MKLKGKALSYYKEFLLILFSSLSLLLSLFNDFLGIPTGFGMTIDLSAVPVFLALFLFSYKDALKVLTLFSIALLFLSPSGFIGAIMKFTATLPLLLIPYFFQHFHKDWKALLILLAFSVSLILAFALLSNVFSINSFLSSILLILISISSFVVVKEERFSFSNKMFIYFIISFFIRGFLMSIINIYFAGPLFFKLSPEQLISFVEGVGLPLIGKTSIFFVIGFWNFAQSIIDVGIAFTLYKNRIIKKRFHHVEG